MGKRSKSGSTASEPGLVVESKRVKNKKNEPVSCDANYESKPDETIIPSEDKQIKRKKKNKLQSSEVGNEKKNKKIIFNDDDNEPIEVDNPPIQQKRTNQGSSQESSQENEEDIKDEDIDKFCDELNEEDNEQYENWVKLIEAKLTSNKKKPK